MARRLHAEWRGGRSLCGRERVDLGEWTIDHTGIVDCVVCLRKIEVKRIVRGWATEDAANKA